MRSLRAHKLRRFSSRTAKSTARAVSAMYVMDGLTHDVLAARDGARDETALTGQMRPIAFQELVDRTL